jgi:hypothetical protein
MQRRIYCILFILLIENSLYSQFISKVSQLDTIASLPMGDNGFIVSAYLSDRIYILQRVKDSLVATTYAISNDDKIVSVYSLLINNDELFPKVIDNKLFKRTVDSLCSDVKLNQSYKPYSKEMLTNRGNLFLTFYEGNNLQIFCRKEALPNQELMIHFILARLNGFLVSPFAKPNSRIRYLNIQNWDGLLKYLKSGTVDDMSK